MQKADIPKDPTGHDGHVDSTLLPTQSRTWRRALEIHQDVGYVAPPKTGAILGHEHETGL